MGSMSANEERALYDAYRTTVGTDREVEAYEDLRRAPSVNEPPPGWSVEEDEREEAIALSEHIVLRRVTNEQPRKATRSKRR